ncbi:GntR family transcriptional regulator [Rhizorhabdus sp.]|jgi:DNA-binding GntR family transcriptional regulator|uniref:GntR family transcriptional regulator n=1 Tax=Rhizorhabdus sp. TaxID=1968843 RepID=UPI0019A949B1|nr:GntR family transcriptional regulator [Rhizorhabdus sp.]MBD3761013.1 GntR family transcriptional regulator [Rhizorhabdus sp.]
MSAGSRDNMGHSRSDRVYETLRLRIHSGELHSGMRLREEELAASLGVSRTPVREALGRLQVRGMVEIGSGGLAVATLSRPQVMEVYAIREILEGAAARFAAENATSADVLTLRHLHQRFEQNDGPPETAARLNNAFHGAIYEAARNRYQKRMLDDLNDALALLPSTTFSVSGRSEAAKVEHRAILDAIVARDPDAAEKAARSHIARALDARLELLFSGDG